MLKGVLLQTTYSMKERRLVIFIAKPLTKKMIAVGGLQKEMRQMNIWTMLIMFLMFR